MRPWPFRNGSIRNVQRSPPHQTWTLTDGHAGNVRQARALADALRLPTRDIVLAPRLPWKWAAPRALPSSHAAFGHSFEALLDDPSLASTLVIGCGRQAALATRLLRERGARAVQVLDPRISTRHWDAVIAPEHDRLQGGNVLTLLGSVNPVTDAWLGASRAAFASFADLPRPRTAMLIGGPTTNLRMRRPDLDRWLRTVRAYVDREGGSVLATTSRRTPEALVACVRKRLTGLPGLIWSGSVDGRNPYAALLGWADRIICTADSVNMLSESAATHAPVHVAGMRHARGRPRHFLDALVARGRVHDLDDGLDIGDLTVEPLRETPRIAIALRGQLGLPPL